MKTINNFIVEHLEYSTFPINEKLKISSKSKFYSCQPKDKFKLRKILEERLAEDKNADLNDIDVSQITDMSWKRLPESQGLFENLDPHNIDISLWDVSNVTDMRALFYECENLNCDLSNWDVSNVTNMDSMFYACKNFNADLSKWDVSSVTYMPFIFLNCKKFTGKGLENWKVSKVENMSHTFYNCTKFNCDLSNWDVSKVKNMEFMFSLCINFEGKGLEKWTPINLNIAKMNGMLSGCKSIKNIPDWCKSK